MCGKEIQRSSKHQVLIVGLNPCLLSLTGNSDVGDSRAEVRALGSASTGKMVAASTLTGHKKRTRKPGGKTGKDRCSVLKRVLASIVATLRTTCH